MARLLIVQRSEGSAPKAALGRAVKAARQKATHAAAAAARRELVGGAHLLRAKEQPAGQAEGLGREQRDALEQRHQQGVDGRPQRAQRLDELLRGGAGGRSSALGARSGCVGQPRRPAAPPHSLYKAVPRMPAQLAAAGAIRRAAPIFPPRAIARRAAPAPPPRPPPRSATHQEQLQKSLRRALHRRAAAREGHGQRRHARQRVRQVLPAARRQLLAGPLCDAGRIGGAGLAFRAQAGGPGGATRSTAPSGA